MTAEAPYGSWASPISAADLAASTHPVMGGRHVPGATGAGGAEEIWWLELRPAEDGRYAVRRSGPDGSPEDLLAAPWNARTRVHEYGGGAWTVTPDRRIVFAEFTDQRLYAVPVDSSSGASVASGAPTPLTPEPAVPAGLRYAQPQVVGDEVWAIRETHSASGAITRDLCAVPLDGSAADDASRVRSVVAGSHFLAAPTLSPDGTRLAWIAWEHPQMPWDGAELRVGRLVDGAVPSYSTLLGSETESVLQPVWLDDATLSVLSDRSGWWNAYAVAADGGGEARALTSFEADLGGPLWTLGTAWQLRLPDGRLLTTRTVGTETLGVLDPVTGAMADIDLGGPAGLTSVGLSGVSADGARALLTGGGAKLVSGLRELDLATGALREIRLGLEAAPAPEWLPAATTETFAGVGGREVHAVVYPPTSPAFTAPAGELPPYIAFVHGGPTGISPPAVDLVKVFFTSRGIGVVDVNYGGSSGYGRAYRERLRGQWGVVDVEDTVSAVLGLADAGLADRGRLAIEGGSAGGWTVLAALTGTDVFACGASYFGVTELLRFAEDTHDFESRYLDGLIGPLPEAHDLYVSRAPLSHVDGLSCPVLLLQGLDDPVVPPSQAEFFRDALVEAGLPHAYVAYEGESHGFRRAETIVHARESELSFYGQVMGFEPPGVPVLPLWRP